jgi:hypothetical protein
MAGVSDVTDRPVLFSAPMVSAHIDETKTQTRRVIDRLRRFGSISEFGRSDTAGYDWHFRDKQKRWHDLRHDDLLKVLPYAVGDRLWVRENWRTEPAYDGLKPREIPIGAPLLHMAGSGLTFPSPLWGKARVGRYMMRWMSRLTDTVTDVRVQRLQDISEQDAMAEGATARPACTGFQLRERGWSMDWSTVGTPSRWATNGVTADSDIALRTPRLAFGSFWERLNGAGSRDANPWIVAVTFTAAWCNIDRGDQA